MGADPAQPAVPAAFGFAGDRAEAVARVFGSKVGAGVFDADEGDADAGGDGAVAAGVEAGVSAGIGTRLRVGRGRLAVACRRPPRVQLVFLPGPVGIEAAVEDRGDVDAVARALATEKATRGRAVDLVVGRIDVDRGEVVGLGTAAGVDQEAGVRVAGEGEARHPGAGGSGQLGLDRAAADRVDADRVVARPAALVGVREAGLELAVERRPSGRGRGVNRLGGRHEGKVAVEGAAGAGEVGEAEAPDVGVAVVIAGAAVAVGRGRVGAPLDHAEGRSRTGEVVATAEGVVTGPGAGEDVDVIGQAGSGG